MKEKNSKGGRLLWLLFPSSSSSPFFAPLKSFGGRKEERDANHERFSLVQRFNGWPIRPLTEGKRRPGKKSLPPDVIKITTTTKNDHETSAESVTPCLI